MKFTLRDLFWVVLIAAILSAWFIDYRVQRALVARERLGAADAVTNIDVYCVTLVEENEKLKKELKAMAARPSKIANESTDPAAKNTDSSQE